MSHELEVIDSVSAVATDTFETPTRKPLAAPATQAGGPTHKHPVRRVQSYRERFPEGIDWPVLAWMAGMHVAAIAAFWFFTWPALIALAITHFMSACLGVTLGYHRLLTHGSLTVPPALKYFFSLCGMMSAEGSPLMWVATHRKHHVHSDKEDDPHSPLDGFWWSHILWFHPARSREEDIELFRRWAPDLYKDPVQQFFHRWFALFPILVGVALYGIGQYFFNAGVSFVLWGLCLRMVFAYHCTWFVNSATHIWGYRNYQSSDQSRNLWWVAILAYGEGWHNNHHAHQRLAVHGHRWWEFDMTYFVIRILKATGLAKDVQDKLPVRN